MKCELSKAATGLALSSEKLIKYEQTLFQQTNSDFVCSLEQRLEAFMRAVSVNEGSAACDDYAFKPKHVAFFNH